MATDTNHIMVLAIMCSRGPSGSFGAWGPMRCVDKGKGSSMRWAKEMQYLEMTKSDHQLGNRMMKTASWQRGTMKDFNALFLRDEEEQMVDSFVTVLETYCTRTAWSKVFIMRTGADEGGEGEAGAFCSLTMVIVVSEKWNLAWCFPSESALIINDINNLLTHTERSVLGARN